MREDIAIFGAFHDGSVVEILGKLPEIALRIEIAYLRALFPSDGDDSFVLRLMGCQWLEFCPWDSEQPKLQEPHLIQLQEPEILGVEQVGKRARVLCVEGVLELEYQGLSLETDAGEPVSFEALGEASRRYWQEWETQSS